MEPPANMSRNQRAEIPDGRRYTGRRAAIGLNDGAARGTPYTHRRKKKRKKERRMGPVQQLRRCGSARVRRLVGSETERGVDRKLLGTSKRASHRARLAPALAPHDPPCWADACQSAIGRPILTRLGTTFEGFAGENLPPLQSGLSTRKQSNSLGTSAMPYRDLTPDELATRKLLGKIIFPPAGAVLASFGGLLVKEYWPELGVSGQTLIWCLAPLGFIGGIVAAVLHSLKKEIRFYEHRQAVKGCALMVFLLAIFCFLVVGISSCRGVGGGGGGGTKIFVFPIRR
jgi:hypothetical protein